LHTNPSLFNPKEKAWQELLKMMLQLNNKVLTWLDSPIGTMDIKMSIMKNILNIHITLFHLRVTLLIKIALLKSK
jgi:hypothetical protein